MAQPALTHEAHAGSKPAPVLCGLSDPLDPDRSVNLNRRYWPRDAYRGLSLLREADELFRQGDEAGFRRAFGALGAPANDAGHVDAILWRAKRLAVGASEFGYATGQLDVRHAHPSLWDNTHENLDDDAIHAVKIAGDKLNAFRPMLQTLRAIHRVHFGAGARKVSVSTRYAHSAAGAGDRQEGNPAADFHFDGYGDFSAVCYLQDVRRDDGPFEFIDQSHTLPQSVILRATHEHLFFDLGLARPGQLESWPLVLRGTPRIGDFLDPDKARALMAHRREMLCGPGFYIVFNGRFLMHRGGMPRLGRRLAVFANPVLPHRDAMECVTIPKMVRPIWAS